MSLWYRLTRRHSPLDDFADAIRDELGEMRVPGADERLLARIRESRASGSRVILPLDDPRRSRRPLVVASAVLAAALAIVFLGRAARLDRGMPLPASESWFAGDVAYANPARQAARYPGARVSRGDRMRPMELRYARTFRDSAGAVTTLESRMSVTRDSIAGAAAWRLVSVRDLPRGATEVDSVWVSRATFAPLRQAIAQAPYRSFERIVVRQEFSGARVRGDMHAYRAGAQVAYRTFDRVLSPELAPYVPDAFASFFHVGVALDRSWAGSVSVLGWAVRDDNVFVAMTQRVDGEEVVRVPAGAFPCWRLALDYSGHRLWYWVRQSDGLGVRLVDSTDARNVREVVLRSEAHGR